MDLKLPKTLRPYVSVDLETTGLDTVRSKVIQISAVIDDGTTDLKDLTHTTLLVKHSTIDYSEPYALGMNGWIFKQLTGQEDAKYPVVTPEEAGNKLVALFELCREEARAWDEKYTSVRSPTKVQIAGKNASNFDYPLLQANFPETQGRLDVIVDHRFLDAGGEFADIFGRNPGLNTINKLIGYKAVTHDALEDALNVVAARRWRFDNAYKEREWIFKK